MNTTRLSSASPLRAIAQPNSCFAHSSPVIPKRLCCDGPINSIYTQYMQSPDFYLDTFFNPIWMPGPHVFSWNPDGTVRSPETTPSPPMLCRLSGKAPSAQKTYAAAAKSALSQGLSLRRREMSPSPSVANAEVEDVPVREVEDDGLVYTWPPNLATYQRETGERGSGDTLGCADENVAAAVLCGASPTMSASTGGSSPLITTPAQSDNGTYVLYGSPQGFEEGALEKMTGLKRLRCKAPPPLCLDDSNGAGGDIGKTACILLDRDGERTAHETHILSPLTAAMEITSKLSARVPAM